MMHFFIKKDGSLESDEIINIINSKNVKWDWLMCDKAKVKEFYQRLDDLVKNGVTPVLVGRKCQDKDGAFFSLSLKVPEGVVVLCETAQDKELIKQVAKLLDYSLTPKQKLMGYLKRMTFAEMRNKGYASNDIIALFDEQFLKHGGTKQEIYDFRQAIENYGGRLPLLEIEISNPRLLELVPAYVGEIAYYSRREPSVLVSFKDGTLPVLVSRSIPKIVCKKFSGHSENGVFYLDAGCPDVFIKRVREVYV